MRWSIADCTGKNIVEHLLALRKVSDKNQFLNPKHPSSLTADDVSLEKSELKKAADRIKKAIKDKEKIVVYGDYDADGVASTAIVWEALRARGADIMPYIPDRKAEGYGFSKIGIKNVINKYNPRLIITVDHGITAHEHAKNLAENGIDLILTDHHQADTQDEKVNQLKKNTKALLHTTKLSGAGIAWYLVNYLTQKIDSEHIGLAALGTVADILPIIGPNRAIVAQGLKSLTETKKVGLRALKEEARIKDIKIESYHIGFILGPRINAAGRLKHAIDALRLLCTNDQAAAQSLAQKLGIFNSQRQKLLEIQLTHSLNSIKSAKNLPPLIILADSFYNEGIIGLIAGKITDKFYRPSIVISIGEKGIAKASARSVPGVNIIKLIREVQDLLLSAGGHAQAAGFSLETESIETVAEELIRIAQDKIGPEDLERVLQIDAQIELNQANRELYDKIVQFEPFGTGNTQPLFCTRGVFIENMRPVGVGGKHLKFTVNNMSAIAFNRGYLLEKLNLSEPVDIAYNLDLNRWNSREILQLKVRDIKQS